MRGQEQVSGTNKRAIKEFRSSHRIAGLIALVVVVAFGATQWMHSGSSTAAPDSAQAQAPTGQVQSQGEYFPAKYVNQATQVEKHIEAF